MPENTALRDYLLSRRSVGMAFLRDPGPDAATLEQILIIGTRVPDHGKLAPWRLVVIAGEERAKAGARLAKIAQRQNPALDAAGLEVEAKRFLPAPVSIGVVSAAKPHPKIPEQEQLLSAGNVAFNLVHAAYAFGFAANWTTRWYAYDADAGQMLGARGGEHFVGFVAIGTPSVEVEDRPRPALETVVTYWKG